MFAEEIFGARRVQCRRGVRGLRELEADNDMLAIQKRSNAGKGQSAIDPEALTHRRSHRHREQDSWRSSSAKKCVYIRMRTQECMLSRALEVSRIASGLPDARIT